MTFEALNDSLDDNEARKCIQTNPSKAKDVESHPAYFTLSYPSGNRKKEKVVFTRLYLFCRTIYEYIQ